MAHLLLVWTLPVSNILLGLAVLWVAARWRELPDRPPELRAPARLAVAYLALLVVSILASDRPATSARALSEVFGFATLGLTLVVVRGARAVRWMVDALILVGAILALSGVAQFAFGYGDLDRRIRGPFSHYMTYAGVLLLVDLLLVGRMLARRSDPEATGPTAWLDRPAVAWAALGAINWGLFGSLTRGAWVALGVGLALVVLARRPKLALATPIVVVAFLLLSPVSVLARAVSITDLSDESNYDRICMAEAGLRMVGERPILGIGPDRVKHVYPLYRTPTAPRLLVPHLHNSYLQLAAERGIPALSFFVAMLGASFLAGWRAFRRGGAAADLGLGLAGAALAFAVAGLFENNWGDTEVQRLALFVLAAPFALANGVGRGEEA